ncbi:UNVERIFIED_CONTAM: hypothetical protein RMT77_016698 [Armadillidium vulgare]
MSSVSSQQSSIVSYTPLTITNQINTSDIPPIRRCFRRLSSDNILFILEDSPINIVDNNISALVSSSINPSLDDSFLQKHPIESTKSSPVSPIIDTDIGVIQEFLQSFDEQGIFTHSTPTPIISKKKSVHWSPSVEIEGVATPISTTDSLGQVPINNATIMNTIAQLTRQRKPYISPEPPWVQDTVLEKRRSSKSLGKKIGHLPIYPHTSLETISTVTITTVQSCFSGKE